MRNNNSHVLKERKEEDVALLKVRRFAQLTLPAEFRKKFNLAEGDYLEAEAVEGGILLKPVTVVEREKAWDQVFEAMEGTKDRKPRKKQSVKEQEEIVEVIKTSRKNRAHV